ncbi:unnamed protein product [Caenorhabditis angaria]|uniref:Uncharacterized protein n=1 Tax=Caenorhabditis angaria TaxID=860376 RepID=A0A9P1IUV3_9PELO|nr:unnamed protein product [Caenorhabditis angaria]
MNGSSESLSAWTYFDSPDFLRTSLHFLSILEVPIHLLGFYCVIFKTPSKMRYVKSSMIQCFLSGAVLDFVLSFGTIPYALLPTLSLHSLGILSDVGVSQKWQTILVIELIIIVGCSIIGILENRFTCITNRKSRCINSLLIYIVNGSFSSFLVYFIFSNCPEQEVARRIVLYEILPPSLPSHFYTDPIFVVSLNNTQVAILIMIPFFCTVTLCTAFALGTIYKLYYSGSDRTLSTSTKNMMNKFFVLICIQCSIPLTVLAFPISYIAFSCSTLYFNQAFCGHPLGYLTYLGMSTKTQTILIIELIIGVGCSIVGVLENRFTCMTKPGSSYKNHCIMYICNCIFANIILYFIFSNCPEQEQARKTVLYELLPKDLPSHFYSDPIYVKSSMIQCCVFGASLDFVFNFGTIPYILFPTMAGRSLGILNNLGMSMKSQSILICEFIIFVACSVIGILENRFTCITNHNSRVKNTCFIYLLNTTLLNLSIYLVFTKCPEQEEARRIVLYELLPPELPSHFYTDPIFVVSLDADLVATQILATAILIFTQCAIFVLGTIYKLYFSVITRNLSSITKRMQNKFFILICLQCSIPLTVLAFPTCYIIFSCSTLYFNQAMSWSYFDSPEFLKTSLHSLTLLEIPIHLLGFYCIMFKTPSKMRYVKSSMIQCCVIGAVLDVSLSFGIIPYVLFPTMSGRPLGFLTRLGVPMEAQVILFIEMIVLLGCSLIGILENRFTCITNPKSSYKNHCIIYIANVTFATILIYWIFSKCPEQESARRVVLYELLPPNLPSNFYTDPLFVVSLNSFQVGMTIMGPFIFQYIQGAFFIIGTIYKLYFLKTNKNVSQNTRRMQNKMFILIWIQCSIPITVLALPICYVLFSCSTSYFNQAFPLCYVIYSCSTLYYNQAFNNISFIFISLHGVLTTTSIMFIHTSYREFIFSYFTKQRNHRKITQLSGKT